MNNNPGYRVTRRRALSSVSARLAPLMFVGIMPALTRAQEAPATGIPVTKNPGPEWNPGVLRWVHPEKDYFFLPGFAGDALRAGVHGLDVETYQEIRASFDAAARDAAKALLADDTFAEQVDRLPFDPGALVIAIGDSRTDDLQSWFEILRHLLELRRPLDRVQFINDAVSAHTTTQAFGPVNRAVSQQPDWIICYHGGNDVTRFGSGAAKTQVSIEETGKNLTELRRLASAKTGLSWVWMTQTPIDEERMEATPEFQFGQVAWRNADIEKVNAFLSQLSDPVVDLHAAFGDPISSPLLGPDGVHPSLDGHTVIAKAVVEMLTA
jgi:lysophospholipase L1-like esterase